MKGAIAAFTEASARFLANAAATSAARSAC
jgi:hypothetical protein